MGLKFYYIYINVLNILDNELVIMRIFYPMSIMILIVHFFNNVGDYIIITHIRLKHVCFTISMNGSNNQLQKNMYTIILKNLFYNFM